MQLPLEKVCAFMEQQIPFNRYLGMKVPLLREGFARFELPFRDDFIGDPFRPALHGGVVSTLLDTCGGAAVWTQVEPDDRVATVDLRIDYLRPGPLADLACEAEVVRVGNRVAVTDMKLFAVEAPERIIATGKGVYNVKRSGE